MSAKSQPTSLPTPSSASAAPLPPFEFHPTPAQMRLMEGLQAADFSTSITMLCRQSNVSRAAYYRWQWNAGFRHLLYQVCSNHLDAHLPLLLMRLSNSAVNGDQRALRLIFPFLSNGELGKKMKDSQAGYNQQRQAANAACYDNHARSADTRAEDSLTHVGPHDQPKPEPGSILIGQQPDVYREYPSGYRPAAAPDTHPDYQPGLCEERVPVPSSGVQPSIARRAKPPAAARGLEKPVGKVAQLIQSICSDPQLAAFGDLNRL